MSTIGTIFKTAVKVAVAAPIGWLVYSKFVVDHDVDLPKALDAERKRERTAAAGMIGYYVDDSAAGRPLVLIHSVNAAASPQEMQPLFDHYRKSRPVYALDLPGFGFSERVDREYDPRLFSDAIGEFLIHVVGEPADVIVLSLSSEFVALEALVNPSVVNSIVMISPTGLSAKSRAAKEVPEIDLRIDPPSIFEGPSGPLLTMPTQRWKVRLGSEQRRRLLSQPLWAQPLFDLIVSRPALRYFSPRQPDGANAEQFESLDYSWRTSHQPGAKNVPLYFVSGQLYTDGVDKTAYEKLEVPTLCLYSKSRYTSYERLPDVAKANPKFTAAFVENAGSMVHQNQTDKAIAAIESFWARVGTTSSESAPSSAS